MSSNETEECSVCSKDTVQDRMYVFLQERRFPIPSLPRPTSVPAWTALNLPKPSEISSCSDSSKYLSGWPVPANGRTVQVLSNGMVVKRGDRGVFVDEGDVMELARLVVPEVVPKAHGFYSNGDRSYLFMDFVKGVELDKAWGSLSETQRSALLDTIVSAISSFHTISLPYIGAPAGSPPRSFSFASSASPAIPSLLTSPAAFLNFVKDEWERKVLAGKDLRWQDCPEFLAILADSAFLSSTSFTLQHCDLAARNIIVDPSSGALLAIIDWGEAAVLPPGFEYAALLFEQEQLRRNNWCSAGSGGEALCRRLMAEASTEEQRLGKLHHAWIRQFL